MGNDDTQSVGATDSASTQATPPGGTIYDPSIKIEGNNRDRFTYGETKRGIDGLPNIYGPKDWNNINCPNVDICVCISIIFFMLFVCFLLLLNLCLWSFVFVFALFQ
jgi:hypothetical protein